MLRFEIVIRTMGFQAGNTSSPRILDGSDVSLSQHDPRTSMHQFLAGRLTVRRNSCTRSPSMLQLSRRPSLPTSRRPGSESTSRQVAHLIYSSRVFRVSGHGWSAQKTADEDTPAMDVTTDRTQSDLSSSGRLPSVAIGPQDRVHVATRHLASKLQVGVRDHQECACRRSRSYGLSSRAHRLLHVPDGRRNHCRPQTSIAPPFLRRLLLSRRL